MSFADELAKLERTRRAFVRFARELNPIGTWSGARDRQYAKTPDARGEVPIAGTVDSFGTFNNFIANHEFPVEVPSIKTTLLDPNNEWRAMAARPSTMVLNRRLGYYVRQHDDADAVLDQLIAIGQIGTPTFPSGKVSLDLTVPGGEFLGETVNRRLLTTRDWPRSLPDDRGKVIPFVYGSLTNTVVPLNIGSGGNVCGTTRFMTSFEGGNNGPAFDNGNHYGVDTFYGPPYGESADPAHPYVIATEGLRVRAGLGPNGENVVDGYYPYTYGNAHNAGPPDYQDWGAAGVAFGGFGPLFPDHANNQAKGAFPADFGCISADVKIHSTAFDQQIWSPLFSLCTRAHQGNSGWITVWLEQNTHANPAAFSAYIEWESWAGGSRITPAFTLTKDEALALGWKNWQLKWKCGTPTIVDDYFDSVAPDGYLQLWAGNTLVSEQTGCDLFLEDYFLYQGEGNVCNGVWLGFFGLPGMATNFKVKSGKFSEYIPNTTLVTSTFYRQQWPTTFAVPEEIDQTNPSDPDYGVIPGYPEIGMAWAMRVVTPGTLEYDPTVYGVGYDYAAGLFLCPGNITDTTGWWEGWPAGTWWDHRGLTVELKYNHKNLDYDYGLILTLAKGAFGFQRVFTVEYDNTGGSFNYLNIRYRVATSSSGSSGLNVDETISPPTHYTEDGQDHVWKFKIVPGTVTGDPLGTSFSVASDGYWQVFMDGQLVRQVTGIALILGYPHANPYVNSPVHLGCLWLGFAGFIGPNKDVHLYYENAIEGITGDVINTPECGDVEDGASDQGGAGRGGYLKALLVDTGGGNPLTDYPSPTLAATVLTQPHAAPTLTAALQAGGSGVVGVSYYYAAATVHPGGVLSELSNVEGPITTTADDRSVLLGFSGLASGAESIRLWRGTTPDFSQFDVYRVSHHGSDLPAATTSVVDEFPGLSIQEQMDPDTHWDTRYRTTKWYAASAVYADGTESACSLWVAVGLQPRNSPLPVGLTLTAPPVGVSPIIGYNIRRMDQTYHYAPGLDRQWSLSSDTLTMTDPNNDISSATSCPTEPSEQPIYCLAGHTLHAVREVFVFKPNPLTPDKTESVWLKMTPGADFTEAIIEVNGNRYHCLKFTSQQRSDTCQYYPVTANVDGVAVGGTLLTDADDIFEHIMFNIILNTYRTGDYFTDVPYSPGLFNRASVTAAKAVAQSRVGGGYKGAGALTEQIAVRQLIHDLLVSYDLNLYQYRGVWYVKRDDPASVVRASLTALTPDNAILKSSFEPSLVKERHFNQLPYFAGPISGMGSNGYLVSGEMRESASISDFGEIIISEPAYLLWTQDPTTTFSVVAQYLKRFAYPPISASFLAPIRWFDLPIASEVKLTTPEGFGPAGWSNHVVKVLGVDLELDRLVCRITVRSIDHEVL